MTIKNPQTLTHDSIEVVPDRMTLDEAAHYLGIPVSTLTTWRSRRPGYGPPAMLYGATLRFRRVDLDQWMESRLEQFDLDTGESIHAHGRGRSTPSNALPSMTRRRTRRTA